MIDTKTSVVIAHHLSDVQTGLLDAKLAYNKLQFVKWLIFHNPNLTVEINPDYEWESFTKTHFYKK
jgi:hypothetical protein